MHGKKGITNYEELANAIILQAVKDYRAALAKFRKNPYDRGNEHDVAEIEKFFRSRWYTVLTDVNGEMLIRKIREEARV